MTCCSFTHHTPAVSTQPTLILKGSHIIMNLDFYLKSILKHIVLSAKAWAVSVLLRDGCLDLPVSLRGVCKKNTILNIALPLSATSDTRKHIYLILNVSDTSVCSGFSPSVLWYWSSTLHWHDTEGHNSVLEPFCPSAPLPSFHSFLVLALAYGR